MRKTPKMTWYETQLLELNNSIPMPEMLPVGNGKQNYRFKDQSIEQAIYLLLVKYVENLSSSKLLFDNGQFTSLGTLTRVMDETGDDLMFLAQTFDNKPLTQNHERFLASFWQEPSYQLATSNSKKPDQVPRNKILSQIYRDEGKTVPDSIGLKNSKDLHAITSTFVHSVAAPIMDIYNPTSEAFEVQGCTQEWLKADHRNNFENCFFRGVLAVELASFSLKNEKVYSSARSMHLLMDPEFTS